MAPADPTRGTGEMRRYDLITNFRCGSSIEEMEPSDDGEWVRYEEVEPLVNSHEALLAALQECRALLAEAIEDENGPTVNYCWFCEADINGLGTGTKEPHVANCWFVKVQKVLGGK